jgi:hypothetical protein
MVIMGEQAAGLAEAGGDDVVGGALQIGGDFLLQAGHTDPGLAHDFPRARGEGVVEQFHQGALARPVPSQETDAFAAFDAEAGAFEDGWSSERDTDFLYAQQRHGIGNKMGGWKKTK